jgi:hypothetical protein
MKQLSLIQNGIRKRKWHRTYYKLVLVIIWGECFKDVEKKFPEELCLPFLNNQLWLYSRLFIHILFNMIKIYIYR